MTTQSYGAGVLDVNIRLHRHYNVITKKELSLYSRLFSSCFTILLNFFTFIKKLLRHLLMVN